MVLKGAVVERAGVSRRLQRGVRRVAEKVRLQGELSRAWSHELGARLAHFPAQRGAGAGPLPRRTARRAGRRGRSRSSAGASASSATATSPGSARRCSRAPSSCLLPGRNEQAMVHAAVGYARHAEPARRLSRAPRRSGRAPRTWSPARRWRRSTGCRCCCCPATSSPRAAPTRCCSSSRCRRAATCRSTTRSSRSRGTGTASSGPSSCSPALLEAMRVLTEPGRDRRGHARAAAGRAGRGVRLAGRAVRAERVWHVPRAAPDRASAGAGGRARSAAAKRPLIVAGGGVIYSRGDRGAARVRGGDRHPGRRDAGGQGLAAYDHPLSRARSARPDARPRTGSPPRPIS